MVITDIGKLPLAALDGAVCKWLDLTYNTPLNILPVIGVRSSLNPLGRQYRMSCALGEFKGKPKAGFFTRLLPMGPGEGPPLPQMLNLTWKEKK